MKKPVTNDGCRPQDDVETDGMDGNTKQKLMLVMDQPRYRERKLELLKWVLAGASIKKEDWKYVYCYRGRTDLPKRKDDRGLAIHNDWVEAKKEIKANQPCVVVGLGRLACECLLGASILSTRAGGCWDTDDWGKVWITYSPDAVLYDPNLVVRFAGTICVFAAEQAGIKTKPDHKVPMFRFEEFELKWRRP